jgi:hypothetical protein
MLEDLVGEKQEEFTEYKRVFKTDYELQTENEKLKEGYERIQNWAKAYPLDVFPKPDLKKAAKVLKDSDMTLDSISADSMRHVLEGVTKIIDETLKG